MCYFDIFFLGDVISSIGPKISDFDKYMYIKCISNIKYVCPFIGYSLPCDPGYVCLTGSDVATPTDGIVGYACPAGYYCLGGAIQETPCPRGYYQSQTGKGEKWLLTIILHQFWPLDMTSHDPTNAGKRVTSNIVCALNIFIFYQKISCCFLLDSFLWPHFQN